MLGKVAQFCANDAFGRLNSGAAKKIFLSRSGASRAMVCSPRVVCDAHIVEVCRIDATMMREKSAVAPYHEIGGSLAGLCRAGGAGAASKRRVACDARRAHKPVDRKKNRE